MPRMFEDRAGRDPTRHWCNRHLRRRPLHQASLGPPPRAELGEDL